MPLRLKLYHVQHEGESYFVEMPSLLRAVEAWRAYRALEQGGLDYDNTEEPESIALVHDEPVIRERA